MIILAIGTISTLIISWRTERRNKIDTELRIEKSELEIEKLKLEITELKTKKPRKKSAPQD